MIAVLSVAHLAVPFDLERGMAISTLMTNEEWWAEAEWNGRTLGDVRVYRNKDKTGERGEYFGSIPAAVVKCYRFRDTPTSIAPHVEPVEVSSGVAKSARP